MNLIRVLKNARGGLALAVGNFDGVHRGHQAIIRATIGAAHEHALTPAVMAFEPMPREFFARRRGEEALRPPRLMSVSEKLVAFDHAGIAQVFLPCFDQAFAAQTPAQFADTLAAMNVRWLMVGEDFRYGAKRAGDIAMLRAAGHARGFTVETMADIDGASGRISSTRIREALAAGRLPEAAEMLGRAYAIVGRVVHGKKLGRTLGFPTANISLTRRKPALSGVFAVRCRLVTRGLEGVASKAGRILDGVANLGTNPVVSTENRHHLEVFFFTPSDGDADVLQDLYGRRVECEFIARIRDEQKFASLDDLVARMYEDVSQAKNILRMTNDGPES